MGPILCCNPEKARSNLRKHGVTFEDAASVLRDVLSVTINDPLHSVEESRFVTMGRSDRGRTLVGGTLGSRGDDPNYQRQTRTPT